MQKKYSLLSNASEMGGGESLSEYTVVSGSRKCVQWSAYEA